MNENIDLSIIVPVSEHHQDIARLHSEYEQAAANITGSFEFIYVIDGKHPEATEALREIGENSDNVRVIQFAKWFGEATALTAGFEAARSDVIVTLPAYFQVLPDVIPELWKAVTTDGIDIAIAARQPSDGGSRTGLLQRRAFNWLVSRFTTQKFSDLGCSARAMRREVTTEMSLYGDQHRFLPILGRQLGFRVREINAVQHPECPTRSWYGIGTYVRRLLDVVTVFFLTKFTKKPLRFFGLIGSSIGTFGLLVVSVVVAQRIFADIALADRPALMLGSLLVVLGVQFFAIGLIGELIIFTHARHIKEYQVAELVNFDDDA